MPQPITTNDPGWNDAHLQAIQPLQAQQADVRAQMDAIDNGTDFGPETQARYTQLGMQDKILDTNIKTMQPPEITDSGQFEAGDLKGYTIDNVGGQAKWDAMTPDQQASAIDQTALDYQSIRADDTTSKAVGGGPFGDMMVAMRNNPTGDALGKNLWKGSKQKKKKKGCKTCDGKDDKKKKEEADAAAKAKADQDAKDGSSSDGGPKDGAPDKGHNGGPATDKAATALALKEKYPGSAVVGVVNTDTGQMEYGNSVARDWQGPRPDGFVQTNGGHSIMFENMTGNTPTQALGNGSGSNIIAFTVGDNGLQFKSGSVNDALTGYVEGPFSMQQAATPTIVKEFGAANVPGAERYQ